MTAPLALQLLVAGVSVGSIYAFVALAIVIPFKTSGVLNFGQGEIVTLGAYVALVLTQAALPYPVTILGVLAVGALGGVLVERIFIRPIVHAPEFTVVIATFAVGLLIKLAIRLHWSDTPYSIDGPFGSDPLALGPIRVNPSSLWILASLVAVTALLVAFFKFTRLGKAMRAVSLNLDAARLMGVKVNRIYRSAWAVSTAIGALTGLLVAPLIGINPDVGHLILKALVASVIGGFTSLPGAVVGGLAVGTIETFSGVLVGSSFKNLVPFLVLMALLVLRPHGLFGRTEAKRV